MRKILSAVLAAGMLLSCSANAFAEEPAKGTEIYVAVDGNDQNIGTKDNPLASMKGARDYIRELSAEQKANGVTVYFRGGEYRWEDVVDFGEQDSGVKDAKIVYRNFPGEKPLMSGGYKASGKVFQKVTDKNVLERLPAVAKNNIRVVDLKQLGIDDKINDFNVAKMQEYLEPDKPLRGMEIFVDDEALEPARWPNKDKFNLSQYVYVKSVVRNANDWALASPRWQPGDALPIIGVDESVIEHISKWKDYNNVHITGPVGWEFGETAVGVAEVDEKSRQITLDYAVEGGYETNGRFYFLNVLDELDVPGEYFLDKENKKMYVYVNPEIDLEKADIHFSVYDKPVMINIDGLSYVDFKGIEFKYSQCRGIDAVNIDDVDFINCEFSNISGRVMEMFGNRARPNDTAKKDLKLNIKNVDILNCVFKNLGNGAVRIQSGNWFTLEKSNCRIENCNFTNVSRIKNAYSPGIRADGGGFIIRNNTVDYGPGVLLQFTAYDSIVEYNELANGVRETSDMGLLYGGMQPYIGTVIRYNYIHDTSEYARKNDLKKGLTIGGLAIPTRVGVYIDNCAEGATIDHNIIENIPTGVFAIGCHTTCTDNIIIDCPRAVAMRYNPKKISINFETDESVCYYHTIGLDRDNPNEAWLEKHPECFDWKERAVNLFKTEPRLLDYPYSNFSNNLVTYNKLLTFCYDGQPQMTDVVTNISDMQKGGSTVENNEFTYFDPGFEDAKNDKYTIKSDAKILKRLPGLAEINQSDMGYMPKNVTDITDNAVVFKAGNGEFFADSKLNGYSENVSDAPFEKDGKLYVPFEAAVKALDGTVDGTKAVIGEQTADFAETVNRSGIAYVPAESFSQLGKMVETVNGTAVISDKPSFSAYTKLAEFLDTLMR